MENKIYRLPKEFLDKLQTLYPAEFTNICRTFNSESLTTFRCNNIKADGRKLMELLKNNHIKARRQHFPDIAFILDSPRLQDLEKTNLYKKGFIYVQNISSMLPPLMLQPQEGEKILDLCSAPGGKTTLLVSLTNGKSMITAVEQDPIRFQILNANIKIQGCEGMIEPINRDGTNFGKENEQSFDRVLVDAPCSAEAGFKSRNARTFAYWSNRRVKECAFIQKQLLFSGIKALKPGGHIIYSTCTFSPEENEEVVQWALDKFKGELELIPLHIPLKNSKAGLLAWNNKRFDPKMNMTRRIIPDGILEGFFLAGLHKN